MAAARRPQSSAAPSHHTLDETQLGTPHPASNPHLTTCFAQYMHCSLSTVNISHYYSATSIYVQNVPIANCVLFLYSYTIALGRWHEVRSRSPPRGGAAQILITPSRGLHCLHCPLCPVCPVCPLCPLCPVCPVCPVCPMCPLSPHCTLGKQSADQLRRSIIGVLVVSAVSPVVNLVSLKY